MAAQTGARAGPEPQSATPGLPAEQPDPRLPQLLAALDWSQPWYASVAARALDWQSVCAAPACWPQSLDEQAAALDLRTACGLPLRFVPQSALPQAQAYEAHIAATGQVPTRANLHDFFNALIWFVYPRIKARLNALQAAVIAREGVGTVRGGLRDALTVFDENAVLFACAGAAAGEALRAYDWEPLLVGRRDDWGRSVEVLPFGHALLEKLARPYKAITAHAWVVQVPQAYFGWPLAQRVAWLDRSLAPNLGAQLGSPRDLCPLPVLGIPGWWPANADPAFYRDRAVFRLARRGSPPGAVRAAC